MNEVAAIITALAALVAAGATAASVVLNSNRIKVVDKKVEVVGGKVDEVHEEVKTANGLTLAQLGDAVETRRIAKIPKGKQTSGEKTHIAEVPK